MNYQPEVRRSFRHSDRKRTRSSYEERSEASEDTSRSKTRLGDLEEEFDFTCAICLEKLSDPHLLPDCCHRFCGPCIKESIAKGNRQCPTCREHIPTKRSLRKDDLMEKLLIRIQKLEEKIVEMKYLLEEKREGKPQDEDNSDANEEPVGAEVDDGDNEIKRPTRKKRKVQGIQEVAQEHAIDAGRRNAFDSRNKFEERFNALEEFKSEHGHCNVPYAYNAHNNLGVWVANIRKMKSGSRQNSGMYKLTNERIKNLENIGFKWNVVWENAKVLLFEDRFNALKEFKSEHGHCNVPYAYNAHNNLGVWVANIRRMKSGSRENKGIYKLTKERIKKLENIGFRWIKKQTFEDRCNALEKFKRKYGHCIVPKAYNAHNNLGKWVGHIRRMKSGSKENTGIYKLTKERIKKLENIGFRWIGNQTFEDRFNALKEFKSMHGHCNVSTSYKAHHNLGKWVSYIRGMKSGVIENKGSYKLTKERIKKLENIGFRWKIQK